MITVKKGDRISEYILEEPLGKGGFGEVWRARHHLWHDRQVAVKIPTRPEAVRDLSNEGIIQATLEHPGIARSLGMDTSADPPYFIVELIEGRSLRVVLDEKQKLEPTVVRSILEQVLDVLEYAHARGVIHQDIKPENILLTAENEVKLTDFGLGQTVNGESLILSISLRTQDAGTGGTIGYIAPEIRDREGPPDGRADLYSVGILLFELLTGRRPAGGECPSDLEPGLPDWCDRVFRGLYTRRETRLADVAAVRAVLQSASPPPPPSAVGTSGPTVVPLVPPASDLVPGDEALGILGVTADKLKELVGTGALKPVSINGALHYDRESLADARESLGLPRTKATPPPVPKSATAKAARYGTKVSKPPRVRAVPPKASASEQVPGGLFVRAIAAGIDIWFVFILQFIVGGIIGLRGGPNMVVALICWYVLYSWISLAITGRTLGKLVLGLRVVTVSGTEVSAARGFLRSLGILVSVATAGFGFWMIPFNRRKQGLHDFIAETAVVYDRR